MTEHRLSAATIRQIEFEFEKAEHGMAMPYDAERVMPSCAACYGRRGSRNCRAARDVVGIWRGAISGNMKVSFQAARSIG